MNIKCKSTCTTCPRKQIRDNVVLFAGFRCTWGLGPVNSTSHNWNDNLQSFNMEKMKHQYQSFARIGRQFQSLKRQVYADWTSVSFLLCRRSCLIWRMMTNTLTNIMTTSTYVVNFLNFWPRSSSFQISELRVHWLGLVHFDQNSYKNKFP